MNLPGDNPVLSRGSLLWRLHMLVRCLWLTPLFFSMPAYAEIYRYIDDDGVVHVSDTPQPGYEKIIEDVTSSAKARHKRQAPPESAAAILEKGAWRMEKVIREKRFETNFYTECNVLDGPPDTHVTCIMYFPVTSNMRQIHKIEAFTLNAATEFARKENAGTFYLYAVMKGSGDKRAAKAVKDSNVKGDYAPVCGYGYWSQFDRLEPLWPAL